VPGRNLNLKLGRTVGRGKIGTALKINLLSVVVIYVFSICGLGSAHRNGKPCNTESGMFSADEFRHAKRSDVNVSRGEIGGQQSCLCRLLFPVNQYLIHHTPDLIHNRLYTSQVQIRIVLLYPFCLDLPRVVHTYM